MVLGRCGNPQLTAGDYSRNEDGTFKIELECKTCTAKHLLRRAFHEGTVVPPCFDNEGDCESPGQEISVNTVEIGEKRFEVRVTIE